MRHFRLAPVMAATLLLAACQRETGAPSEGETSVRMMHTAATTDALDLIVGGSLVAGGVYYEQASAPVTVPAGLQTFEVRRSGQTSVLATRSVDLTPGARYTVVVSGSPAALVLTPSAVVDTGMARPDRANLRIINVSSIVMPQDSSTAPPPIPLEVYLTAPGAALSGVAPQLSLDARFSSYSSLLYFDPGDFVVRFVLPGTTTVVAETAPFTVAAGQVRAVTLMKNADGTWKTAVVAE